MKAEEALIRILQAQFTLRIDEAYGSDGVDDFICCLQRLRLLYKSITPGRYSTISAFVGTYPSLNGKGREMRMENIHSVGFDKLIVCLKDDNSVVVYQEDEVDVVALSECTFVYYWERAARRPDQFYVKGTLYPFSDEEAPAEGSLFAVRTYADLDEALINYRDNFALMCRGRSLQESMTPTRLFFNPAPENLLQEALDEYLNSRLRNCVVTREHIVDTSHPVDIICRWSDTNHVALIEIKWVGKSLKEGGKSIDYHDARAREGASQLVGYIDNNGDTFPRDITVGYLVVYDLRRRNNNDPTRTKMSRTDADYYKDIELNYDPKYELIRSDYKKPYRFFIKVSNDVYEV